MRHIPRSNTRLGWQNTLRRPSPAHTNAPVERDAERHLSLDNLDGALLQRKEAEKIRVRRGGGGVEDDLHDENSISLG